MAQQQTPSMASIPTKKEKHRSHKRKKTERNGTLTLDGLKTLGHQLLTSRAHINNLPVLLSFISPSASLDFALESLISIQSFFTPIVPELPSSSVKSGDGEKDPEAVYRAWLRTMFDEFVNSLIAVSVSPQSAEALRDIAMESIMDFVKTGKNGKFQTAIYHRFLHSIVHATSSDDSLLDSLASKYFNYIDVRFFTYTSMVKIAKTCDSSKTTETKNLSMHDELQPSNSRIEDNIRIIYNILSHMPPLESADKERSYEMWSQSGLSMDQISRRLKLKFTKAWLSFLKSPLPLDVYKEVLVALHKKVIPHMANPAILCDFLTKSYDIGGVISVMALSGLFILMTQYGLEYPNFYEKLYALLTPAVFMAKHRAVFFQLLDTCLKSSYLPAYLAAAFAKKLSRLALSVPPSGAVVIIAVIYNLLRRHPSINFLVHQEFDNEINADDSLEENVQSKAEKESNDGSGLHIKKPSFDPFDDEESNPAESGAMRSSLWEMDTLRNHYCPAVSRFVASMENDLTNRAKTSEVKVADFGSGSYATIFGDEMRRRIKQVPLAFYKVAPTSLFWESDFAGWTFGDIKNYGETIVQENGVVNNIENDDHEHVKRQCIERP